MSTHAHCVRSWPVVMHTQRGTLLHSSSRPVRATSLHSTQSARSSQTTYFTSFVPDEDLRGRYIVRCRYLLCESSSTQLSYVYEAIAISLYNILIFLLLIYSYSIFYNNIMCHHLAASKQKGNGWGRQWIVNVVLFSILHWFGYDWFRGCTANNQCYQIV